MVVPLSEPIPGTNNCFVTVPKGTILAIPVNVMQTDTEIYGLDADTFRPQRWLEPNAPKVRELLAFSEGYVLLGFLVPVFEVKSCDSPRSCIGRSFAICEIKASFDFISSQSSASTCL
jgi:cytochrome P450